MQSTLLQQGITILLFAGWWLITTGMGRLCLNLTGISFFSRGEQLFLSFGVGLIWTGYTVFILGIAQSLSGVSIGVILITLGILGLAGWLRKLPHCPSLPNAQIGYDRLAAYLLTLTLFAGFLLVLTPEIGKDALIYHLAVPRLYLAHHGFYFVPGNAFAGYPLLGEMQYVLALYLQNDILAKTMHYSLLCGTLLGMGLWSRFLMREHSFPALSMLLFVSIPSVFMISHTAYNDLFVAFFTLAAIYTFRRWSENERKGWLILCAIFSGSAAACKYTALLLTPLGCLGILWVNARKKASAFQAVHHLAFYAAAAFLAACPFYIKNWIMLGNPFYPFFHGLFGGLGWDSDQARMYDLFIRNLGMGRDILDYILLPWNLSFRAKMDDPQFDGILGPIFLLTLPFLIGMRQKETSIKVLVAYAFPTFLFWASSAQQIRYLIPLLSLLSLVSGAILSRYRDRKVIFGLLAFIIIGSLTFNGFHIVHHIMKIRPLNVAVGLESRDAFLARMIPVYPMYRFVNRELPPESRVFLIYMKNLTYLCSLSCYADAMFETHTLQKILRDSSSPVDVRNRLRVDGFTHLLYDEFYLLGDLSPLSPEEKSLFISFRESECVIMQRSSSYRLDRLI
jgi:hypothetical protein